MGCIASTASHEMITGRMQLGAERILSLINEGKDKEAQALRTTMPTQERQEQARLLEGVFQRLTSAPNGAMEVHIHLQFQEIHALNNAILGFCTFVRQKVPASQDRDETLQDLERFRQMLLAMLPAQ